MPLRTPVLKLSRRAGKILSGIVVGLLLVAALSAWLVPKALHHALTQNVAQLLGREVKVGQIRFNPFTLALSAQDLVIEKPQSPPLLQISKIDLRIAWRSIILFAPILDRLQIEQPQLSLVRTGAAHFNFSDIIDHIEAESAQKPAASKPATQGLPRFSLNNLSLTGGTIRLDDKVTGRQQTIDDLVVSLPFISSLSYATQIAVQPAIHMHVNGSPLTVAGTALPFDAAPAYTLNVALNGLALDKWADFWPLSLPVTLKSALLDSQLKVSVEQPQNEAPRVQVQGDLGVRELDLTEATGTPLVHWDRLELQGVKAALDAQSLSIDTITLDDPQVEIHQDARQLNWQRVVAGLSKLGGPAPATDQSLKTTTAETLPAPTPTPPSWKLSVGAFKLNGGKVHLQDDPIALNYSLQGLAADAQHINWPQVKDQPIAAQLSMSNPTDGSSLMIKAPVMLQPLSIQAQIELNKLALAPLAKALHHFAPITVKEGRLSLAAKVDMAGKQFEARDVKLALAQFAMRDDSTKPGVDVSVGSLALDANRLGLDAKPTSFTLRADGIQKHGTLALKGTFTTQPLKIETSVDLTKFNAATLAPYVASRLNATVRSLSLGARGRAEFAPAWGTKPLRADWRGAIEVNGFNLEDRVNKAPFLNWKHLGLSNMRITADGSRLQLGLGDILLDGFYGNILLNSNAHLNVTDILVDKGRAAGSITQDTQTRRAHTASRERLRHHGSAEPDISIHSVNLRNGRMTFNDHFVRPNYRAELSAINGTLSAVSSTRPTPATVSVAGRVYNTAPFSVSGTVQPFTRYLALDLKASAKNVDLPRFTTYSSKYVGYAIERGKLSVDLQYQIKDRQLQATNKVVLNQLTFGDPSGSPDAIKLPVLLAVSLLKDSSGNIDMDVPISGSLDDPQFSVGGIIVKVIVNTLAKAITAPFKLLASAFGGAGGADLSRIEFAPDSAALDDAARSSIATLIKALNDRPALKMDIIGRADPKADEKASKKGKQALIRLAQARAQSVYEQILATAQNLTDRVFIVAPKVDAPSGEDTSPTTRVDFALQ
ncbi:MAG TPA: DUF748 domain-containing protein [Castellaniella sp.]|uniref:DUF748 domain-containing protein n=1 Tax=Castellaniella sp. TaxID=1955812 RepID=UPI002F170C2C